MSDGVQINDGAQDNTIGAPGPDRNVISGNSNSGVLVVDASTAGNVVQGNFIGSNASASAAFPNGGDGVAIQAGANANVIGGTAAGTKNVIAFNVARGVSIDSETGTRFSATRSPSTEISASISARPGSRPERSNDPDPGANLLQNFPVLFRDPARHGEHTGSGNTEQHSVVRAIGSSSSRRSSATPRATVLASGSWEPRTGTTDSGGNVSFDAVLTSAALGPWITATATDVCRQHVGVLGLPRRPGTRGISSGRANVGAGAMRQRGSQSKG